MGFKFSSLFRTPGQHTRRGLWLVIGSILALLPVLIALVANELIDIAITAGTVFLAATIVGVAVSVIYFWRDYRKKKFKLEMHFDRLTIAATVCAAVLFLALLVTWIADLDVTLETEICWLASATGGFAGISVGYTAFASEAEIEYGFDKPATPEHEERQAEHNE